VLTLSDRILVLREGRLVGELSRAAANQERLLRLMAGLAEGNDQ
jgi:ABC-type sugar transport system ATPase subunit